MPGQAHLCSSVGMHQLQPWYVPVGSRPYMNLCAPRYKNVHVPTVRNQPNLYCARFLRCIGTALISTCLRYVSPSSYVCCVCTVNLFVKAKRTLAMYTLELKHISTSSYLVSRCDICAVLKYLVPYGLHQSRGIRHTNFGFAVLGVRLKGSIAVFGALRLECGQHAAGHREEHAGTLSGGQQNERSSPTEYWN